MSQFDAQQQIVQSIVELSDSTERRLSEIEARIVSLEKAAVNTDQALSVHVKSQPRLLLIVAIPSVLLSVAVTIWLLLGNADT